MPNAEDPTRLKRVKRLEIKEVSGVDKGGAPEARIVMMRDKESKPRSAWDWFTEKFNFKRSLDVDAVPMTVKEIADAREKSHKMATVEMDFNESIWRILENTKGSDQVALLKQTVAEFAEATEGVAEMQRRAQEIGAVLNDLKTSDLLPAMVEEITRALKPPSKNPENQEVENMPKAVEEILAGLSKEDQEVLKRDLATPVEPAPIETPPVEVMAPVVTETPTVVEPVVVQRDDAATDKLVAVVEKLIRRVDDLSGAQETDELVKVARKYSDIGKTHDEIVEMLRNAKTGGEVCYTAIVEALDSAQANAASAEKLGFFAEAGASGAAFQNRPDSVTAKVERKAQELVDEGKFTEVTLARADIYKNDPSLRKLADKEQRELAAKYAQ